MDKKTEFNEALSALVEYATVNGNIVSADDVHEYFKNILDEETLYVPVYSYLKENNITVKDYTDTNNSSSITANNADSDTDSLENTFTPEPAQDSETGKMFIDMYLDDLKKLTVPSDEELEILIEGAIKKDKEKINQLTEAFLNNVIKISEEFEGNGMKKSDLISEGNIGLLEAVLALTDKPANIIQHFEAAIRTSIYNAIQREIGIMRTSKHLVTNANAVNDATTALAEKLGREATIEELCEYLSLSEEKVREILKISLDAINVVSE